MIDYAFQIDGGGHVKSIPLSEWRPSEKLGIPREGPDQATLAKTVAWLYRGIHLRASAVQGMPFEITGTNPQVDVERITNHLPDLLYRTEASLLQYGAAYIRPVRNRVKVFDLRWFVASSITPNIDDEDGIVSFERNTGHKPQTFYPAPKPPSDLIYIWMPDADVEIGPGRAPVQVILTAAAIIANANKFVSEFFERGGLGVTLLITDPTTSEADLKRLEGWWKKVTRGIKKAWETVALRKNVDVRQFGYPLNQLELGGMRGEARAEIAGALGIPLDLLTTDSANYATAREHRQSLYEETIKPRCDFIAATLNEQFFHPLGLELVFHPEQLNVFQKAENEEVESLARLVELGIISPNEARERLGFKGQAPPPTAPTEESLPPSEGAALGSFSPPAFTPEGATALQEPEV